MTYVHSFTLQDGRLIKLTTPSPEPPMVDRGTPGTYHIDSRHCELRRRGAHDELSCRRADRLPPP